MITDDRRMRVVKRLQDEGSASVADLAEEFSVSPMTMRRDLRALDSQGLVRRVRGGAMALSMPTEVPYPTRLVENLQQKQAIAERAVRLVSEGMSVFLAPGTTVREVALRLPSRGLRIVTNSMPISQELVSSENDFVLTGGTLRRDSAALFGPTAEAIFDTEFLHIAFIGVSGISVGRGITVFSAEEARVMRAAIRSSKLTCVLADSSKFDSPVGFEVVPLWMVHRVITDDGLPTRYQEYFAEQNITVDIVGLPRTSERPSPQPDSEGGVLKT